MGWALSGSTSTMLKLLRIVALLVVCGEALAVQREALAAERSATYAGRVAQFFRGLIRGGMNATGSERGGVLASICQRLPDSWFANSTHSASSSLYEVVQRHLCDTTHLKDRRSETVRSAIVTNLPMDRSWTPVTPLDFTGPPTATPLSVNPAALASELIRVPSASWSIVGSESPSAVQPGKLMRSEVSAVTSTVAVESGAGKEVAEPTGRGKVLFFIATDDSPEEVLQMQRNLKHAQLALGEACCDVYVAHYAAASKTTSPMVAWSRDWYLQNVVGYLMEPGYKFSLLQKAIQQEASLAHKYEFVWAIDSDIDLTKSDLRSFFRYARCTEALIVGPTFGDSLERQRTDHRCLFRHSDFVELTAPLFRAKHLAALMTSPLAFQAPLNRSSDWGLDLIWCKLSAHLHNVPPDRVCGIVDAAPLSHAAVEDGGGIKKKAGVTQMFFALRQRRIREFSQYESKYLANLSCHETCGGRRIDSDV